MKEELLRSAHLRSEAMLKKYRRKDKSNKVDDPEEFKRAFIALIASNPELLKAYQEMMPEQTQRMMEKYGQKSNNGATGDLIAGGVQGV